MQALPPRPATVAIVQPARRATAIERLDEHQARIRATLGQAAVILNQDEPDTFELALLRWKAMRELREYQLFKHHTLFDPVIRRSGADAARIALMKSNCIALGERVTAHALNWSSQVVASRWSTFAAEAGALLRTLELRMRTERAECLRLELPASAESVPLNIGETECTAGVRKRFGQFECPVSAHHGRSLLNRST